MRRALKRRDRIHNVLVESENMDFKTLHLNLLEAYSAAI